ncbi:MULTISPECIES: AI-2E family transporter [Subtercola]|uniref:AI-2E family transporter n=1 Tax=Subtercola vilae TaxID=2056433 RepID=A0A4T2C3Q3_9MICO|nr:MULTISPECIES: AI-2E family transporter [Subtercola]MEA9986289.1 AI-2E family transporter [Subtercola sp. RTI3]TIH38339.1 AI-2E family transporter [Subtercola vilae]
MKIRNAFTLGLVGTLGVGLGILILFAISNLATVLTYVGIAVFLALGLDPLVSWLERKRFPRSLAILIVIVGVAGIITGLVFAVLPIIVDQLTQLFGQIPPLLAQLQSSSWASDLTTRLGGYVDVQAVVDAVTKYLQDPGNITTIAGGALAIGVGIANGVFGVVIVFILTLFFTANLSAMKRTVYLLVPASSRERFADLGEQVTDAVGRYVIGQVTLAACNGVLSFIYLSIIQAPYAAVLAFIAGILSLIPLVGTISGSVIIVLICLIPGVGSPATALAAGIYYLVYMQVEAYLLSPNIMRRAVSVPGAVVVIAALAGGSLLGVLGALVAIPIAASIMLIVKQVVIPAQNER